ncbi:MAG: HD domain-containing protein [Deltaproteobacteria bacterium]|nr:HD domain-containing protein [Deltaproteobacteria bacterium]
MQGSRGGVFPGAVEAVDEHCVSLVPGHILRAALQEVLLGDLPDLALVFLHRTGVLASVLPEVTAMIDFQDEYARHKDLWTHTVKVVAQVEASPVLRWAALLHDIGKVRTRSIDERGRVHFFGHEITGARMFKPVSRRLGFPVDQSARIRFLIRNHLRAGQYDPDWTDSAVRRFGREMGDTLEDLIKLSRADITTKYERKKNHNLMLLDGLLARVHAIREQDAVPPALPRGLGNVLMERYSLEPGRRLGRLMTGLKDVVEAGGLPRSADHEVYLRYLDEHPDMLVEPK